MQVIQPPRAARSHTPYYYDISSVTSKVSWREVADLVLWCGSLIAVLVVAGLLT